MDYPELPQYHTHPTERPPEDWLPKPECLVPGCSEASKTRGLCGRDYAKALGMVNSGRTTWKELEVLGLTSKPTAHCRPINAPFEREVLQRLHDKGLPLPPYAAHVFDTDPPDWIAAAAESAPDPPPPPDPVWDEPDEDASSS